MNRNIPNRVTRTEKSHGAGGWVRKAVWHKIKKLPENIFPDSPKPRSQIHDDVPGHNGSKAVEEGIAEAFEFRTMRLDLPGTDHHIVALFQLVQ